MVEVLDCLEPAEPPIEKPLRFPVQDVYRMGEERIIVGRVESGAIREGDEIHISPTEEVATVTAIDVWPDDPAKVKARAGEVIGIRLDRPVFVERGHIISHNDSLPMLSNVFQANIVWLGRNPLKIGNAYKVRFATTEAAVTVQSIERVINTDSLGHDEHAGTVPRNSVAQVTLRARELLALDSHTDNDRLGRLVIYDGYDIAGGGRIETEGFPDQRRRNIPKSQNLYEVSHLLNREARARQKGHHGGVIWFTGLSGAGKSTIAMAAEKALFERGYHTYVLDGDNVRHGLNADLGFSPEDRAENIRRVGEVAALMADAGQVVITSFISPYRADRGNARAAAPEHFHEIYVRADLDTCETRDPKGLYKRAREGEIADFTGIDAPYEVPDNPELVVDTQHNDLDTCVEQVVTYIAQMLDLEQESSAAANQQRAGKEQIIA
jgi:bifunctional enzyme CysN/CysC